ncbi:hypothetical protein SG34_001860 [Thalassomonas viridans]|uniref:Tyrosine specific protein phosphatases domain-containing protein n=1 Tax=Thalassomonas viridans TaxID=137584 RepID=A0AAE9Z435_9GAMM|nr:hypothetical protein [Thalassomonas viridans]WDE05705.1 hypothetical protein SG34_001860 [Thalassomonas viridans]
MLNLAPEHHSYDMDSIKLSACFYRLINTNLLVGGKPDKRDILTLKEHGIERIINCLSPAEQDWDESSYVTGLGLKYQAFCVDKQSGINLTNAGKLKTILAACVQERVFLHCATGNRIGALIALHECRVRGKNIQEAISEGELWGLKNKKLVENALLEGEDK